MRKLVLGVSLLSVLIAQPVIAEQASITEFRQKQVELFDAQGQQPLERRDAATLNLPIPIKGALASGFYQVEIDQQGYAVRKRSVRTDRDYTELSSSCNNTLEVAKGAVSRGLGKGEC